MEREGEWKGDSNGKGNCKGKREGITAYILTYLSLLFLICPSDKSQILLLLTLLLVSLVLLTPYFS